jgi:predicted RND superfamily exporter protein
VIVAVALGLGAGALALGLRPTATADTFVGRGSADYRATQRFYGSFGEEPVEVLVKGNLEQLVLSSDIEQLAGLEGCLSGNVPPAGLAAEGGVNGPCAQIERAHTVKVVLGPGTFIAEAAEQISSQLAAQSRQAQQQAAEYQRVITRAALARGLGDAEAKRLGEQANQITMTRYTEELLTLGLRYGLDGAPSISDTNFVSKLVFERQAKTPGTPKQRFAYLFPSREAALVSVRMRAGLSEAQRSHTIALIRAAVAMPQWRLAHGETYLITGEPAIVSDLTSSISASLRLLLIAVLLVMALMLGLVFTGRPRLLPLALALLATALTFGVLSLTGSSLTIAQVAVLPVLVGLAVDYAIQVQSGTDRRTIALAALASMAAFLVLLFSPVPTVRGFGALLVVGVALALGCALGVGPAAMTLARRRDAPPVGGWLAAAWQGARELVRDNVLSRGVTHLALVVSVRRPGRVLGVGLALAALGWGLDTQTPVQTDISKLVPQNLASLSGLNTLERTSGVGGEIDLMIGARDLSDPAVIEWMSAYENKILTRFGYSATRGCGRAQLCPAFSLPDLFGALPGQSAAAGSTPSSGAASSAATDSAAKLTRARVRALLAAIPPYFSQDVITPDRRVATLAFGIRLMSLSAQQRVIEQMRAALHPPPGVSAQLVGLPVLAAAANAQVSSVWWRMLTLLGGLLAVALVLLIAFRGDGRRALVPLVPVALATGWSALVLFALRVSLNPMSVTLGVLVIAISTEFSVLLSERHRQERIAGHAFAQALRRGYDRTGAAVAASGVTAIAGFGVLVLSDINMLRDFGVVTLVDLSVSLLGVMVALPAALLLAERGVRLRLPRRLALTRRPRHEPV